MREKTMLSRREPLGIIVLLILCCLIIQPANTTGTDTKFHADLNNSGVYDNGGITPTNTLKWAYTTGASIYSNPAIANGVVYVGCADGNVYAINASTGSQVWSFTTNGMVYSSPAVADGVVYVGGLDHNVYAINANTGSQIWSFTTGNIVKSSPAVANGVVYVGSFDNKVYAINASTGSQVWSFTTGNYVASSPAVADGVVYVGSFDNKVYAINASTGSQVWSFTTGQRVFSSPAVANGVVYVGSEDGKVYAINAGTGAQVWTFTTGNNVQSCPAVANGVVYVGSLNNNVYAIDAGTGSQVWSFTTGYQVESSPAVANGVVYVGSMDGKVYAIDAGTGSQVWTFTTGDMVESSPAVANGVVYIGSDDGKVYALGGTVAPVAGFTGSPASGTAPLTVVFTDSSTHSPTLWDWSFGDGSTTNATLQNPVHTYVNPGTYTVSLNATNAGGSNVTTWTNYITVNPSATPPVANFSANLTSGTAPLPVLFTDLSSNLPTGWTWYFGDEDFTAPWTKLPGTGWSVDGHSSVAMPDGSIVLMGGFIGGFINDVWRSTDNGSHWTEQTPVGGAEWSVRENPNSVAMPDGSIVLMGGYGFDGYRKNDVWRSTDNGAHWTEQTAGAEWSARESISSVAMPDGSILLMGGFGGLAGGPMNDTWRSTNNGTTWMQVNASAGWTARYSHTSVAMPDGSIVLMGGYGTSGYTNDVWRSIDDGATWTQQTASAGWTVRSGHTSVAMPDGSIVLMGGAGCNYCSGKKDVWRSDDQGKTWTQLPDAGWSARTGHSSFAMPDGSIVLMGGYSGGNMNDVWRFMPAGSSAQDPSHIYSIPGTFSVALQAYNAGGYNSTRKAGYIVVTPPPVGSIRVESIPPNANVYLDTVRQESQTNHTFENIPTGGHTVQVNLSGYVDSDVVEVTVENGVITTKIFTLVPIPSLPPVADFAADPISGYAPLTVYFTDESTLGDEPYSWEWNFGDGNFAAPWTQQTVGEGAGADWPERRGHSSVVLPDSSIVLMGGWDNSGTGLNDTWRSMDGGVHWTEQTADAGWSARTGHSSVAMGSSIVLMGGWDEGPNNDVWLSTDKGETWTQLKPNNANGWTARESHSSVAMGSSIVLMGGHDSSVDRNDVWVSTDDGASWTEQTAGAEWSPRSEHSSVVLSDGSIVLMGGFATEGMSDVLKNDVWRSMDGGVHWTEQTADAGWSPRREHSSVVMPDGSIVLIGGDDGNGESGSLSPMKDVWRSEDEGATWTQLPDAGWTARWMHSSVAMPDGSIVLMGGQDNSGEGGDGVYKNDVWRLMPAGSTEQNPLYEYTLPGIYSVTLKVTNAGGSDEHIETDFIDVWPGSALADALDNPSLVVTTGGDSPWSIDGTDFTNGSSSLRAEGLSPGNSAWLRTEITGPVLIQFDWKVSSDAGNLTWDIDGFEWDRITGDTGWLHDSTGQIRVGSGTYLSTWTYYQDDIGILDEAGWVDNVRITPLKRASFTADVTSGPAPLEVRFNQTLGSDAFRVIVFDWDFGDGVTISTNESDQVHRYDSPGSYDVTLTLAYNHGTDTLTKTGYVNVIAGSSPVAAFSGSPTSGTAPLSVTFTDSSTGSPTGWAWFFGDEIFTGAWTEVNASADWSGREGHALVAMPDGSIVLMGGSSTNDTWRSTDNGATWTEVNASAGWSGRVGHSSVVMPDGSIVLMGGYSSLEGVKNDVWRSTDNGATWTEVNASAGWSARLQHSSVVMPDGSIVLMGGYYSSAFNDVWCSTDNGATWTQVNASAGWSARDSHTSVVMPDGSIVLMGGNDDTVGERNDVWRSTDNGATWAQVNASAGWPARDSHTSVVIPDGSIVLMGGEDPFQLNDIWRSTDNGATWTQVNASAGWSPRLKHRSVAMPDGSIVLMGGYDGTFLLNDVWRFMPVGSSLQNPSHIYTAPGIYQVALQAYNAGGYNSTRKTGYITVAAAPPVASFTANVTSGIVPLTVQFNDTSTGSPTSWNWSFGDSGAGNTSQLQNPVHTYNLAGYYTVSLNVTNSGGSNLAEKTSYINVSTGYPVRNLNTFKSFSTIQAAINDSATLSGHTIEVDPGTYTENVMVTKSLSIRSTSGNPDDTIIRPNISNNHVITITANYVNISGFTMKNATGTDKAGIYIGSGIHDCSVINITTTGNYDGTYLTGTTNVTIRDSDVSGNNYHGILLYNANSKLTISGSNISENKQYGIFINANNQFVNISDSIFTRNGNGGIGTWFSGGDAHNRNVTIVNNTFANHPSKGIFLHHYNYNWTIVQNRFSYDSYGLMYDGSSTTGITINWNNFSSNKNGISLGGGSDALIRGNTFWNNSYGIWVGSTTSDNNVFYDNIIDASRTAAIGFNVPASGSLYDLGDQIFVNNTVNDQLYYHSYGVPYMVVRDVTITDPKITNCGAINLYGNNTVLENVTVSGYNYTGISLTQSNNVTISHSDISENAPLGGYYYGIRAESSTNVTIRDSNVSGNNYHGIYLYNANSNVTISGSNISGNKQYGIFIQAYNQFVNISDSIFTRNGIGGIGTWYSGAGDGYNQNVTIVNNTFANHPSKGIFLHSYNYNWTIIQNRFSYDSYGLMYDGSSTNRITINWNNFSGNNNGISLGGGSDALIRGNTFWNNSYGIWVSSTSSNNNEFYDNIIDASRTAAIGFNVPASGSLDGLGDQIFVNNTANGRLYYHSYGVPYMVVRDVTITDQKITNCGAINLYGNNTVLENVTVTGYNYTGIHVTRSNNVTISQSNISGNAPLGGPYYGIRIEYSTNVSIQNSTIKGNTNDGIRLFSSNYNVTISDSNLSENKNSGMYLDSYNKFVTISNSTFIANAKAGIQTYWSGVGDHNENITIFNNTFTYHSGTNDAGVIIDDYDYNWSIVRNRFILNDAGIFYSANNPVGQTTIKENNFSSNNVGINSDIGDKAVIQSNTFWNNSYAVNFANSACDNNEVYLNNFLSKRTTHAISPDTDNRFNQTAPVGGNYWDDYASVMGIPCTDANSDGFCDVPYNVSGAGKQKDYLPYSERIDLGDLAPRAAFTANITSGTVPLTVQFNDASRYTPTSWNWSFGDGNFSAEQNPVHLYEFAGTFTVSLNATNAVGSNVSVRTGYIIVNVPAPAANFTANITAGFAPLSVQFIDNSTGFPTGWNWTFGDIGGSNTSTLQNPVHTYLTHGNFTVSLNAANTGGNSTIQKTAYISVRIKGDINNNDHVDIGDVTSVAYMVVRLMPPDIAAADFNSNGRVDIGDAAKIAYYYVGKIGSL